MRSKVNGKSLKNYVKVKVRKLRKKLCKGNEVKRYSE